MAGYGHDTATVTLTVTLPDGARVTIVGQHDGVNPGYVWDAAHTKGNVVTHVPVTVDQEVLIDGITPADDDNRDWGAEGVHWTGIPGDEIQRLDVPDNPDVGDYHPRFEGDMHAAIHVARNSDFPWVLYEKNPPDVDDGRWFVTVLATEDDARAEVSNSVDYTVVFAFDGRQFDETELEDAPGGNGYLPPKGAITR